MKKPTKQFISINARVLKNTAIAIKKLAEKDNRSLNNYMQLLLDQHIEAQKNQI